MTRMKQHLAQTYVLRSQKNFFIRITEHEPCKQGKNSNNHNYDDDDNNNNKNITVAAMANKQYEEDLFLFLLAAVRQVKYA